MSQDYVLFNNQSKLQIENDYINYLKFHKRKTKSNEIFFKKSQGKKIGKGISDYKC